MKFNTNMMPIIFYTITAKESYAGLEKILDEKIVNPLNRIEGVGSVSLSGVPGRKVYVDVDPRKMEAYNLSIEQIGAILRAENLNTPAGFIEMGQTDYPLRIEGEFPESDLLKNIVVSSYNGSNVYLKDIAIVRDTIRESKLDTKINGVRGMGMYVQKQSGGNTVQVTKEVDKNLAQLAKELPPDVKIDKLFDLLHQGFHQKSHRDTDVCGHLCCTCRIVLPGKVESDIYYNSDDTDIADCSIRLPVCYRGVDKYRISDLLVDSDRDGGG
jgi:HAE1 family hydrophobic/amphiphilic exporter-1